MRRPAHTGIFAGILAGIWLTIFLGCSEPKDPSRVGLTYTEDARKAYEEAMQEFRDEDWETAKTLFEEVRGRFALTHYARLAELRLSDIAYEQGQYAEAAIGYREFLRVHRTHDSVQYAHFRLCKALFEDISDTVFLPPQEERDQDIVTQAYQELRAFRAAYPASEHVRQIEYMLEVVTSRLVRHELYVARYYLARDRFESTLARIGRVLRQYPDSDMVPEALVLKGETLLKMGKRSEAAALFSEVAKHGGPFAEIAKRFSDENL